MNFVVQMTIGSEVVVAGHSREGQLSYHGAPLESGIWQIDIAKFEDYMVSHLASQSFGSSVDEFIFGLEIAELEEWGRWFKETRNLTSYRQKMKQLLSVGQIEWLDVKSVPIDLQLSRLGTVLVESIERINTLKRKPKDFDVEGFSRAVQMALSQCDSALMST